MMCLQAHDLRELEFSFASLDAALIWLKRIVFSLEALQHSAPADPAVIKEAGAALLYRFDAEIADDLMTPCALPNLREALARNDIYTSERLTIVQQIDAVLGLQLGSLSRTELRIRPATAIFEGTKIEERLPMRRARKDLANADRLRVQLEEGSVFVLDGDLLDWEWRVTT